MYQMLRLAGGTSARGSNVLTGIQVGLGTGRLLCQDILAG